MKEGKRLEGLETNPIMEYEEWFEFFEAELRQISGKYEGFERCIDIKDLLWRAERAVPLTDWEAGVVTGFIFAIKMVLGDLKKNEG